MVKDDSFIANRVLPRSLKERQREERAELILQAAETVLAEKGYYDTSIDEIAARVGIAKGTVYLHFPSKEDLVVALFEREMVTFSATVEQAATQAVSARERLENILRQVYMGIHGCRAHLFLSLSNSMEVRSRLAEKKGAKGDYMASLTARIGAVMEEGKVAGEFDPDIPTAVMVSTFWGLLSPKAYDHLLKGAQLTPEELVSAVTRIYFCGVSTHSSFQRRAER